MRNSWLKFAAMGLAFQVNHRPTMRQDWQKDCCNGDH